jgi:hypothetical protein
MFIKLLLNAEIYIETKEEREGRIFSACKDLININALKLKGLEHLKLDEKIIFDAFLKKSLYIFAGFCF